jgi:hypothetical protein
VESFTAVRIGRVLELPSLFSAVRSSCLVEYMRRIKYIVGQRSTLAHSDEATGGSFPMSHRMRQWWISQTEVLAQEERDDGFV